MRNEASDQLAGPILVEENELRAAYALVEGIRLKNTDASTQGSPTATPSAIRIELADGQKYTVGTPDEALTLDNKRKGKIVRVVIESWAFSKSKAVIRLGSTWWGFSTGAEIEVSGDVSDNRELLEEFRRIFDQDKDLLLQILSAPTLLLATILTFLLHLTLDLFSATNLSAIFTKVRAADIGFVLGYLSIFWGIPILIIQMIVQRIIGSWLGRAVFLWGGGKARYENRRKIILFLVYTIPVAVLGKLVASHYGIQ